jgi:hypothetical protein
MPPEKPLTRKGVQLELDTYNAAMGRVGAKTKKLADAGTPRKVTMDEVIAEALGLKR